MKYLILFIILLPTSFFSLAQVDSLKKPFGERFNLADQLVEDENYHAAVKLFKELQDESTDNANLNFKIGFCYLKINTEKEKAITYLKKASLSISDDYNSESTEEKNAPTETLFFLGKAYHANYRFEDAINILTDFKTKIDKTNKDLNEQIDKEIEECNNGIFLKSYPVEMSVTNLKKGINSEYDEHSPVISADESVLIFTSKRKESTGGKISPNGKYYEDIYISEKKDGKWTEPQNIGTSINTENNEASIGLSVDGQQLFIYKDDKNDGNIYTSKLEGNTWSNAEKLPDPINTKAKESHASLSADATTLYFTSDRKGGFGGMDIYVIKKLPNGKWSEIKNLGPQINTKYNEEGPFIHPDGVTLFFSSEGHKTMGGYDIFFSTLNENNTWSEPENIGYPINTTENDVFYTLTPDGKRAYYASYQDGGEGGNDLYLIGLPGAVGIKPLTVFKGTVTMTDGSVPSSTSITITDINNDEEIGKYIPNSKTGKFLIILPSGKNYNLFCEAENHFYFSETFSVSPDSSYQEIEKAIDLKPIVFANSKQAYYIKFDPKSSKINPSAETELKNLATVLAKNPNLIINMSSTQAADYEMLSDERMDAIAKNLSKKQIDKKRLYSDILTAKVPYDIIEILLLDKETKQSLTKESKVKLENEAINNKDNNITINYNNKLSIIENILFAFDRFTTENYNENFKILSEYLKNNPTAIVEIQGHTDSQGGEEYNMNLSIRRANFVKQKLIEKGVKETSLTIKGFGETQPIAINTNRQSKKLNRRVEYKVITQGTPELNVKPIFVPEKYKIQ